jgi:hypothetical protein
MPIERRKKINGPNCSHPNLLLNDLSNLNFMKKKVAEIMQKPNIERSIPKFHPDVAITPFQDEKLRKKRTTTRRYRGRGHESNGALAGSIGGAGSSGKSGGHRSGSEESMKRVRINNKK